MIDILFVAFLVFAGFRLLLFGYGELGAAFVIGLGLGLATTGLMLPLLWWGNG